MSEIYIHVPFCLRKCPYCSFYSVTPTGERLEQYVQAVCRNIRHYAGLFPKVETIYFGGGTPSLLSAEQIDVILQKLNECFAVASDAEITMEVNPATEVEQRLQGYRSAGINRMSIGMQSMQEKYLRKLNRLHSVEQAIHLVEYANQIGLTNLSGDLMIALPNQTMEDLQKDLREITQLPLQHISAYILKVEEATAFGQQGIRKQCPDEDMTADMYLEMVSTLERKGFLQYEVSNFAKSGQESRHNSGYWKCKPYLGIGPAAHSCVANRRFFVDSNLEKFLQSPVQEEVPEAEQACNMEEKIMLGLRLREGIPVQWLAGKEKMLEQLIRVGYGEYKQGRFALTAKGFLVSNAIISELI